MRIITLTGLLFVLLVPATTFALPPDVSESDWFAEAVSEFVDAGYIDGDEHLRPNDPAKRFEFVMILVELKGGTLITRSAPVGESFSDLSPYEDFYPHFEEAANQGWMNGVGNCAGEVICKANPRGLINRAEAAALLARAYTLNPGNAPVFDDNPNGEWFSDHINVAASSCILKGDSGSGRVRPADNMNRAEMIVMLHRLHAGLRYPDCDKSLGKGLLPRISNSPSSFRINNESDFAAFEKNLPMCNIKGQSKWNCTQWTSCTLRNSNWTRTRQCDLDVTTACKEPRIEPIFETCIPSKSQEKAIEEKAIQDKEAVQLLSDRKTTISNYDQMVKNQSSMYSELPYYSGSTSTLLFQIANEYSKQVILMKAYYDKVSNNTLRVSDNKAVNGIVEVANSLLHRFDAIVDTEINILLRKKQQSPKYIPTPTYVPTPTPTYSPPKESQEQKCNRMTSELALSGGFGSSGGNRSLYLAGCVSVDRYCSTFAGSSYAWEVPAECK